MRYNCMNIPTREVEVSSDSSDDEAMWMIGMRYPGDGREMEGNVNYGPAINETHSEPSPPMPSPPMPSPPMPSPPMPSPPMPSPPMPSPPMPSPPMPSPPMPSPPMPSPPMPSPPMPSPPMPSPPMPSPPMPSPPMPSPPMPSPLQHIETNDAGEVSTDENQTRLPMRNTMSMWLPDFLVSSIAGSTRGYESDESSNSVSNDYFYDRRAYGPNGDPQLGDLLVAPYTTIARMVRNNTHRQRMAADGQSDDEGARGLLDLRMADEGQQPHEEAVERIDGQMVDMSASLPGGRYGVIGGPVPRDGDAQKRTVNEDAEGRQRMRRD